MIPANAVSLVKKWEGFRAKPYLCPANVWTIGYGTTRLPDGTPVGPDTPEVTEAEAEELMRHELERCVRSALFRSPILQWFPERLGAIASFIFNLGPGRYAQSTLRRRINQQDWESAFEEIQRWVYAGGRRLPGLIARRKEEASYLSASR